MLSSGRHDFHPFMEPLPHTGFKIHTMTLNNNHTPIASSLSAGSHHKASPYADTMALSFDETIGVLGSLEVALRREIIGYWIVEWDAASTKSGTEGNIATTTPWATFQNSSLNSSINPNNADSRNILRLGLSNNFNNSGFHFTISQQYSGASLALNGGDENNQTNARDAPVRSSPRKVPTFTPQYLTYCELLAAIVSKASLNQRHIDLVLKYFVTLLQLMGISCAHGDDANVGDSKRTPEGHSSERSLYGWFQDSSCWTSCTESVPSQDTRRIDSLNQELQRHLDQAASSNTLLDELHHLMKNLLWKERSQCASLTNCRDSPSETISSRFYTYDSLLRHVKIWITAVELVVHVGIQWMHQKQERIHSFTSVHLHQWIQTVELCAEFLSFVLETQWITNCERLFIFNWRERDFVCAQIELAQDKCLFLLSWMRSNCTGALQQVFESSENLFGDCAILRDQQECVSFGNFDSMHQQNVPPEFLFTIMHEYNLPSEEHYQQLKMYLEHLDTEKHLSREKNSGGVKNHSKVISRSVPENNGAGETTRRSRSLLVKKVDSPVKQSTAISSVDGQMIPLSVNQQQPPNGHPVPSPNTNLEAQQQTNGADLPNHPSQSLPYTSYVQLQLLLMLLLVIKHELNQAYYVEASLHLKQLQFLLRTVRFSCSKYSSLAGENVQLITKLHVKWQRVLCKLLTGSLQDCKSLLTYFNTKMCDEQIMHIQSQYPEWCISLPSISLILYCRATLVHQESLDEQEARELFSQLEQQLLRGGHTEKKRSDMNTSGLLTCCNIRSMEEQLSQLLQVSASSSVDSSLKPMIELFREYCEVLLQTKEFQKLIGFSSHILRYQQDPTIYIIMCHARFCKKSLHLQHLSHMNAWIFSNEFSSLDSYWQHYYLQLRGMVAFTLEKNNDAAYFFWFRARALFPLDYAVNYNLCLLYLSNDGKREFAVVYWLSLRGYQVDMTTDRLDELLKELESHCRHFASVTHKPRCHSREFTHQEVKRFDLEMLQLLHDLRVGK